MPVKPKPVAPSPAATLVLLRDRDHDGVDVLLIQRHRASKFAAGDFVFPGGKIEVDDVPADADAWCTGLTATGAAEALGPKAEARAALGYWIGAIREAFEEVGILLAYDAGGHMLGADARRLDGWRRACQRDHRAFWDLLRAERLTLATDRLTYIAHWITPEERPIRFDTRFFVAPTPPGQAAVVDDQEIIGAQWLTPSEALAARERGEISLRVPTMKTLGLFEGAASVDEALARVGGRTVLTIRPRLITEGGRERPLLPGDPGYF